jgi:hypothetical protein
MKYIIAIVNTSKFQIIFPFILITITMNESDSSTPKESKSDSGGKLTRNRLKNLGGDGNNRLGQYGF